MNIRDERTTSDNRVHPVVVTGVVGFLGWLVVGEAIDPRTVVAGAVIVFAVALIVTARSRMKQPNPRATDEAEPAVIAVAGAVPAPAPRSASTR